MSEYTLTELDPNEAAELTKELQAVLEKYDAEIGVSSAINIMKRVPLETKEPKDGN